MGANLTFMRAIYVPRGAALYRTALRAGLAAGALALAACGAEPDVSGSGGSAPAETDPAPKPTSGPDRALDTAQSAHSIASNRDILANVLADQRRDNDRKRDAYRHPVQTLDFFQVTADQSVIEYAPGTGWYTRILAPYLARNGRYIAVSFAPEPITSLNADFQQRLREAGEEFSATHARKLELSPAKVPFYFTDAIPAELDGTIDRVLIVRMLHNLVRWDIADSELAALRRTLKPGGMVGVVQHRAKPDAADEFADGNAGYLRQADVVALFERNGFELTGFSQVNANPADTADHEAGVWTLPPTYALRGKDRERYAAIGESDRMTLLFSKAE